MAKWSNCGLLVTCKTLLRGKPRRSAYLITAPIDQVSHTNIAHWAFCASERRQHVCTVGQDFYQVANGGSDTRYGQAKLDLQERSLKIATSSWTDLYIKRTVCFFFPKTRYMRWIYRIFNGMMELGRDTELQRGWQFKLKKLQSFVLFAPFPNAGKLFYTAQFGSCFPSLGWINSCWWLRVSHKLFSLDNGEILTKLMLIYM